MVLAELQSSAKKDPDGYREDVLLQFRHYKSLLDIVRLQPQSSAPEFVSLVDFLAHMYPHYREDFGAFPSEVFSVVEEHYAGLNATLRRSLSRSLILLRNKGGLETTHLLPLFFKMFRCKDKQLRRMLFQHIVSDIAASNRKQRAEKLNKAVQSFLHDEVLNEDDTAAKKSLNVLIELYKRNVWTDERTVNLIASGAFHPKARIMMSVLKFLLGQDEQESAAVGDDDDDDDSEGNDEENGGTDISRNEAFQQLSHEQVFRAYHKGTAATKKKKRKKLKREVANIKKRHRKEHMPSQPGARFAALQLIRDPQGYSEKLFSYLRNSGQSFDTKLLLIQVISRLIGVHKVLLVNFYPFLQRFAHPNQRDVTTIMASVVQACHDLVPPDSLQPLLRHIVDNFVHDRARPEVIALGLHTVREMCARNPLIMSDDLLQDLCLYKKYKEKAVTSAARSLIQLFRQLEPSLLQKKDRGKEHDPNARRKAYGEDTAARRVDGAELLEQALEAKEGNGDDSDDDDDDDEDGDSDSDLQEEEGQSEEEEEDGGDELEDSLNEEGGGGDDDEEDAETEDARGESFAHREEGRKKQQERAEGSLSDLKRQVKEVNGERKNVHVNHNDNGERVELEKMRTLTQADYKKIRMLKTKHQLDRALGKHGARKAQKIGNEEVHKAIQRSAEDRVDPSELVGDHRHKPKKEEKLQRIKEGRAGTEPYGASAKKRKKKKGGLSNKEKEKKKSLPLAARKEKAAHRRKNKGVSKRKANKK